MIKPRRLLQQQQGLEAEKAFVERFKNVFKVDSTGDDSLVPIRLSTATHESMEDTPLLKCFLLVVFYCRVIIS